jgi:Uma2 family endonuclease
MNMGATTQSLMSFEEFERLPDQPGKRELVKGELIELPPAEFLHDKVALKIFRSLDSSLDQAHARGEASELGDVYPGIGYKLEGDGFVVPDVSVTHAGQAVVNRYLSGAPAIAVQVISPANTVDEMDLKAKLYFEHGAREVWRIHRKSRFITVHTPGQLLEISENDTLTTPLLPGFQLPVREILGK